MSKYNIGDMFIVSVTDIDDSGMGTLYTLSDKIMADEFIMDKLQTVEFGEPLAESEKPKKEYTPEDLMSRIVYLSNLLNDTINKYCDMKGILDTGIPNIDETLRKMSL